MTNPRWVSPFFQNRLTELHSQGHNVGNFQFDNLSHKNIRELEMCGMRKVRCSEGKEKKIMRHGAWMGISDLATLVDLSPFV